VISAARTSKGTEAITSDRWHVVHSQYTSSKGKSFFTRVVHSEHLDRAECLAEAKQLLVSLVDKNSAVPTAERDEVFIRRPNFKTLKRAKHRISDAG
jgi:hypothetical protein